MLSLKKESFLNFKSLRNTHIIQKARNAVYDNLISLLDHTSPPKNLAIQAQAVGKQVNAKSHAKKDWISVKNHVLAKLLCLVVEFCVNVQIIIVIGQRGKYHFSLNCCVGGTSHVNLTFAVSFILSMKCKCSVWKFIKNLMHCTCKLCREHKKIGKSWSSHETPPKWEFADYYGIFHLVKLENIFFHTSFHACPYWKFPLIATVCSVIFKQGKS